MEIVGGLLVAGVIAALVVMDARSLHEEETAVFGTSSVSPGLWGAGVFLFAIIFLPAYILTRISHNKRLIEERASMRPIAEGTSVASVSRSEEIARAHALLAEGAITQAEYDDIKAAVLS